MNEADRNYVTHDAYTIHMVKVSIVALGGFDRYQVVEANAPAFFHTLEAKPEIDRERNSKGMMSLEDVQPSKNRSLVVRGASSGHSSIRKVNIEFKWFRLPAVALLSLSKSSFSILNMNMLTLLTG